MLRNPVRIVVVAAAAALLISGTPAQAADVHVAITCCSIR